MENKEIKEKYTFEDVSDFIINNSSLELFRRYAYVSFLNSILVGYKGNFTKLSLSKWEKEKLRNTVSLVKKNSEYDHVFIDLDVNYFMNFLSDILYDKEKNDLSDEFKLFINNEVCEDYLTEGFNHFDWKYCKSENYKKLLKSQLPSKVGTITVPVNFEVNVNTLGRFTEQELRDLWKISDEYVVKKFRVNSYVQNTAEGLVTTYQTTAEFEKPKAQNTPNSVQINYADLDRYFRDKAQVREFPVLKTTKYPGKVSDNKMLEIMLTDLHYGLTVRDGEKEVYNMEIVENLLYGLQDYVKEVVQTGQNIDTILIVAGSDFLHCDNDKHTTTSGTSLIPDMSRPYMEVLARATNFLIDYVDSFASRFPYVKIKLVLISGNHDAVSTDHLGITMKAYFSKDGRVEVIHSPDSYQFIRYGTNLIGLYHGDERIRSVKSLPGIMYVSEGKAASECTYKAWHLGHQHRVSEHVFEESGIVLKWFPSLAHTNRWGKNSGYIGAGRGIELVLFDYNFGLDRTYYLSIDKLEHWVSGKEE